MAETCDRLSILKLCKKYLGQQWSQVDESNFQATQITQGLGNRLFVCGPKTGSVAVTPDPVLVRFYGGNFLTEDIPCRYLTEAGEVLVFREWSQMGNGPQLYGVFEGGRIEEFLPSRLLTVDEWADDGQVSAAVARQMARFHCMDMPAPKVTPEDFHESVETCYQKYLVTHDKVTRPQPMSEYHKNCVDEFLAFDVMKELDWFKKATPLVASRTVFGHLDVNRGNTLLKMADKDAKGQDIPLDQRVVLVDYEFSGYGPRGADIGHHFCTRVFDYGQKKWLTKKPYPSELERRHFISAYLDEFKKNNVLIDWDDHGQDSVDHLLIEAEFYQLRCRLSSLAWLLSELELYFKMSEARKDADPEFEEQAGMGGLVKFYYERKRAFLEKYVQFDV